MIAWAIETLVATTLLMLIVLILRAPVRRAVGPQIAYALWALPVLRMLLPPLPAGLRPAIAPIGAATEPGTIMMIVPVAKSPALPEGWGLAEVPAVLIAVWAAGALLFIGWHVVAYSRFCARLRAGARRRVDLVDGRVAMIESAAAAGPLAFGVWRKYVAFPADFAERYDDMERDLALAHELGHHARGDLAANWIALTVLAIHWFNPVAWRAFRAFRADQEMACDALVLAGRHPALRHAYGRAIVKSAHGGAVSAACHLHTINEIKGRLRMLTKHQKSSRRAAHAGLTGIAALTVAGLALTASGTRAAETLKARVEDRIGVSIDAIEMPALPTLPTIAEPPQEPIEPVLPPEPTLGSPTREAVPAIPRVNVRRDGRTVIVRRDDAVSPVVLEALLANGRAAGDAALASGALARARLPRLESKPCGGDGPTTLRVAPEGDSGSPVTVICTDRIERRAEAAAKAGAAAEANAGEVRRIAFLSRGAGLASARMSIRHARRSIEAQPGLSEEARAEALAGLDQAMKEVEAELGRDRP